MPVLRSGHPQVLTSRLVGSYGTPKEHVCHMVKQLSTTTPKKNGMEAEAAMPLENAELCWRYRFTQ
jgi:hypothetical protein